MGVRFGAFVILVALSTMGCGSDDSGGGDNQASDDSTSAGSNGGSTSGGTSGGNSGGMAFGDARSGEGTYYAADGSGACLFDPSPATSTSRRSTHPTGRIAAGAAPAPASTARQARSPCASSTSAPSARAAIWI